MNYKIFQICFQVDQISKVDSGLVAFDNTENKYPELREYYNFLKIKQDGVSKDLDAWGVFGPRWQDKIRYSSSIIHDEIQSNPGFDVYIFNHARIVNALYLNVWEHGEGYHPGISRVVRKALEIGGYDSSVVDRVMLDEVCFCSYFVATKQFWSDYMSFLASMKDILDNKLPPSETEIYYGGAGYARDPKLYMFPFIVERLFSTFLVLNPAYKIYSRPYDYSVYASKIKDFSKLVDAIYQVKKLIPIMPGMLNHWANLRAYVLSTALWLVQVEL